MITHSRVPYRYNSVLIAVCLSLSLSILDFRGYQQALDEVLQSEREAGLKEARACAAAAEVAATAASSRAAGGADVDPQAAVSSRKMKVGENKHLERGGWGVVPSTTAVYYTATASCTSDGV